MRLPRGTLRQRIEAFHRMADGCLAVAEQLEAEDPLRAEVLEAADLAMKEQRSLMHRWAGGKHETSE